MLGLRDQIGGDELRVAARGEDDRFGGAGEHVDRAIGADDALRGGDEAVARAENFIDARNRARAVGERGNGLRAAHARDCVDAERFCGSEQRGPGCGLATTIRRTPASCAGITVISSVETSENRPPGR